MKKLKEEDIEEAIEVLNDFIEFCSDKKEKDIEECKKYFHERTKDKILLIVTEWIEEFIYSRVRLNINHQKEDIETIKPFHYCPPEALEYIPLGRLNLPGNTIFYTSINDSTCIKEMKINIFSIYQNGRIAKINHSMPILYYRLIVQN